MHAHLDSVNLLTLLNKTLGEPWRQLPQLDRDRATIGVNNDFAPLEIRDVSAWCQMGWQRCVEQGLQLPQAIRLPRKPGKGVAGGKVVFQQASFA